MIARRVAEPLFVTVRARSDALLFGALVAATDILPHAFGTATFTP